MVSKYIGEHTLRLVWVWICVFFNLVGIGAVLMLVVAEVVIIANDFDNYVDQYGHSYPAEHYVGEAGCGTVAWTNAPKHTGSAIWMILYQLSIIVFSTLVVASDLAWRRAKYNEIGHLWVSMFYARGILPGEHNGGLFYYVVANGFLKMFLVVLYMSQSFYGLKGGSHRPPDLYRVHGGGRTVWGYHNPPTVPSFDSGGGGGYSSAPSTAHVTTSSQGGTVWTRALVQLAERVHPDPKDPNAAYGTELWAEWAGWIVLGSVLPSVLAFIFLVPWAASKNDQAKPADEESGKADSGKADSG